jgi:hypothetical protein
MRRIAVTVLMGELALAQTHQPFQSQSPASVVYGVSSDGIETVEATNVTYQVANHQHSTLLLLRTTTRTKEAINEIGMDASTTVEAWPVGVDLKQKPVYTLKTDGMDCRTVDDSLLVILRGVEEVPWWSVYKLETGQRLYDTYVPLVGFSIRRDVETMRYAGLEVPEDDAKDARLREPHMVAVLTYASAEHVLRKALITSDDPKQATSLRSFADASRSVALVESPVRALKISISQNYPSPPATVTLTIPIVRDDLDLRHAQMPAHLHIASWKR